MLKTLSFNSCHWLLCLHSFSLLLSIAFFFLVAANKFHIIFANIWQNDKEGGRKEGRKNWKNNTLRRKKYISFLPFTIYDIPFSRKTLLLVLVLLLVRSLLLLSFSFHRQSEFSSPRLAPLAFSSFSNRGIYFFRSCYSKNHVILAFIW